MDSAQREIDLILEYRTRLLTDIVTGKLDVREWAAPRSDDSEHDALADGLIDADDGEDSFVDGGEPETDEILA
jgi:type I restriction enzyme S subunit